MILPNSFFESELRSGYFVSEKMKRFWASSLEVLDTVNKICERHGIVMYADYGTLLGAIRHKGFIPWDDDIDVTLLRSDYEKMLHVLPLELPEGYKIYSHYNSEEHVFPNAFVNNAEMVRKTKGSHEKLHGCMYPTGIDIFPIDTIPDDADSWKLQKNLYNAVYDLAHRFDDINEKGELEKFIPQIEEFCSVKFDDSRALKPQLWKLADRLAAMFREDEGSDFAYIADIISAGEKQRRKKNWYNEVVELDFEGLKLAAPVGCLDILKVSYGDFEIAKRGTAAHEYPVYKRYDSTNCFMSSKYVPQKIKMENINVNDNKVLFLIRNTSYWNYMEPCYKECKAKGMEVQVVVLPFQYKIGKNLDKWICQEENIPDYMEVKAATDYYIEKERPCRVYFHDPFDEYSYTTQVADRFFLSNIRRYTKELIQIFPFDIEVHGIEDEMLYEMIKDYVKTPGFYIADEIKVTTEMLREFLIMTLTREFGSESKRDWDSIVKLI